VVEGSDRLYPILSGLPERFFLIKHAELGEGNEIISINGQTNPLVDIRPGEMQFWRITAPRSSSSSALMACRFMSWRGDGHPLTQPQKVTEFCASCAGIKVSSPRR
jgi:suppressor of ftsI